MVKSCIWRRSMRFIDIHSQQCVIDIMFVIDINVCGSTGGCLTEIPKEKRCEICKQFLVFQVSERSKELGFPRKFPHKLATLRQEFVEIFHE